jgi:hypothetical protein
MGSWQETCALTRVHIRHRDPVVAVVVRPVTIGGTRIQLSPQDERDFFGSSSSRWRCIEYIDNGHYNDYGSLEEWAEPHPIHHPAARDDIWMLLFHERAWNLAQTLGPDIPDTAIDEMAEMRARLLKVGVEAFPRPKLHPRIKEFIKVYRAAGQARLTLIPPPGHAPQFGSEGKREMLAFHKLRGELMEQFFAEEAAEGDELPEDFDLNSLYDGL